MWTHVRNGKCCPFPFLCLKHMIFKSQLHELQNFWSEYYQWFFVWGNDWNKAQSLQVNSRLYWNLSVSHDIVNAVMIITDAVWKNQSLVTAFTYIIWGSSPNNPVYIDSNPIWHGQPTESWANVLHNLVYRT